MLATLILLVLPALAIVAALKDATSYTIPNWISVALIAGFIPAALVSHLSLGEVGASVLTGFIFLLAGMGMFALGWIGGGDAKFMAAAALWLGWPASGPFILVTAVCGGALSVGLLTLRSNGVRPLILQAPSWVGRLATPKADAPYGVAICIGALYAFPLSGLAAGLPLMFPG
ncbi:MAG: pilus assembly protein CpaA [Caulobacterales bacterium 68-7]|nr:prepilin peptidase [Caulobacterales bacterium]OJU09698.1 MAG: pilus assembly protein CpaA [Caulobacterales bacterium 68-7]